MQALIANNIKAPISPIFMLIDKVRVIEWLNHRKEALCKWMLCSTGQRERDLNMGGNNPALLFLNRLVAEDTNVDSPLFTVVL